MKKSSTLVENDTVHHDSYNESKKYNEAKMSEIDKQRLKQIESEINRKDNYCILRLIVTCLDSLLYLEAQYKLCDTLLALQEESHLENGDFMLDECSVARNSLLVAMYFMGGAEECARPPYYIHEAKEEYSWPLFSTLPPPQVYSLSSPSLSSGSVSTSLNSILSSPPTSKEASIQWLVRLRKSYLHEITTHGSLSDNEASMLLRSCVSALLLIPSEAVFPAPPTDYSPGTLPSLLSQMEELGVQLVSRYSSTLCIKVSEQGVAQLRPLLLKTRQLCSAQQHKETHHHGNRSTYNAEKDYIGFDWLTAIVYLIMCSSHGAQSHDMTWQFMKDFSQLLVSGYLWMPRLHLSSHIPKELVYSGIHPIISATSHYVELILHEEVPLVYSSFRLSGYAPAQVCQQWLRQCFLNYLNWSEIKLYLTTCIVMGTDYQVYMCVAILNHLEEKIIKMAQSQQLLVFLKEEQLSKFHVAEWLGFMERLQDKYRELVLLDMQELGRV